MPKQVKILSAATTCLMLGVLVMGTLDYRLAHADIIDGWDVEGMHGQIAVTGSLSESPCKLRMDSVEQSITLDPVPSYRLKRVGSLSQAVPVHIRLTDCGAAGNMLRDDLHEEGVSYYPDQLTSFVTFNGVEDDSGDHLFKTTGEARGVALRLEDPQHHQVFPGEHSRTLLMNQGDSDVVFYAMLERTPLALKEGPYAAVLNFSLSYH